jgi:hypothetical protein
MGAACSSKGATKDGAAQHRPVGEQQGPAARRFEAIRDKFETVEEVQKALREAGLESSDLVLAIDLTKSNEWSGKASFEGAMRVCAPCIHASCGVLGASHVTHAPADVPLMPARCRGVATCLQHLYHQAAHLEQGLGCVRHAMHAGECLHSTRKGTNPYSSVISILCKSLAAFDDDTMIPTSVRVLASISVL